MKTTSPNPAKLRKRRGHVSVRVVLLGLVAVVALAACWKFASWWKLQNLLSQAEGRNVVLAAEAVRKIGQGKYDSAVPVLEGLLGDKADPQMRLAAIEALGAIGDEKSVGVLTPFLKSDDPATTVKAAEALGRIGDAQAVEPLCQALENPLARTTAMWALGAIGDFAAYDSVSKYRDDSDPYVAYNALQALKQLGSGG